MESRLDVLTLAVFRMTVPSGVPAAGTNDEHDRPLAGGPPALLRASRT